MPSIRNQVITRVMARLTAAGVAGANIFRSRTMPLERGATPAIVIRPAQEQTQGFSEDIDRNHFELAVEIIVRGDPWDELADAVDVIAHPLVTLRSEQDGLQIWDDCRRTGSDYQPHNADLTAGALVVLYRFTYLSAAADITQRIGI